MEKAILEFASDFNLVKKGKKTGRPVYKDYDCKFCGEKNPDNFNTKYKTTCKKCKISKATEKYHTEAEIKKITEEDIKIKKFVCYFYEELQREFRNNVDDENKLLDEFDEKIINNLLNNCIYNKIDRTLKITYKVLKMEFKN
jgi:hypothetical protein